MKNYKMFTISTIPFNVDQLSGQLWNLDIEGITEEENFLIVYSTDESFVAKEKVEDVLKKLQNENFIESYIIEESTLEEINWNEEWERNLKPIRISDKILIKQSFNKVENDSCDIVITIDPKMSFGTGEHETTKLVLQLLEEIPLQKKSVLDVGSGTAILAIAAAKLGAEKVLAFDNDEWCFENGIENVKTNHVENIVELRLCELNNIHENNFDLILANINRNILLEIPDDISKKVEKNGFLILSGLLTSDEEAVKKEYIKKGFRFIQSKRMNEWIALKFSKQIN
ncbi:MAG: 50S ribosomal protein L11 methyltransferase [Melioribacteraceae bacterium]|nr:50S ribosomal protein L11 methyltransferase [Melioribacteraceae bacterium]